jgi:hypothetical protein
MLNQHTFLCVYSVIFSILYASIVIWCLQTEYLAWLQLYSINSSIYLWIIRENPLIWSLDPKYLRSVLFLLQCLICPQRTVEVIWLLSQCIISSPFLPYTIFRAASDTIQLSSCLYTGFPLFLTGQSGLSVSLTDHVHLVPGLRLLRTWFHFALFVLTLKCVKERKALWNYIVIVMKYTCYDLHLIWIT